jgi:predicted metal-dependent phosphoesterase TrpH
MRTYRAELHVHTVLSPCAEVEMIPPLIILEALERGIQIMAITDHNASANVAAVLKAAAGKDLTILPGMEVQTQEEVHVLTLFDTLEQVKAWQTRVSECLPALENNPEYFGEQFVVDETGDFIRREHQLLLTSTSLTIEETFREVEALGGLAIPAHVDRKAYGLIEILGFIPPDLHIEALEVSRNVRLEQAHRVFPQLRGYPLIQGGDAHRLDEFLGANEFTLERPTIAEIRLALHGQEERRMQNLPLPVS